MLGAPAARASAAALVRTAREGGGGGRRRPRGPPGERQVFYLFAILGMTMFRANDPIHFGSLATAMLTLFRISTLEDCAWWSLQKIVNHSVLVPRFTDGYRLHFATARLYAASLSRVE